MFHKMESLFKNLKNSESFLLDLSGYLYQTQGHTLPVFIPSAAVSAQ